MHLTQRELAEKAHCATGTVKKIEADERRPSVELAGLMAAALNVAGEQRPLFIESARGLRPVDALPPADQIDPEPLADPGPTLGGYELRERIGSGSFGVVYRAYQPAVRRDVAIKIIRPDLANHPDFVRRFDIEAQLVARLEHPHIVPLYDYWRDAGGAYLVMRWLRGGSLADALARGSWNLAAASRLLDQIAAALSLAHQKGIAHRDIKPSNLLLDEAGNAYLSDFGIAVLMDAPGAENDLPRAIDPLKPSTPEYSSPEQLSGGQATTRSDIYSLGIVLFEILSGLNPLRDRSPSGYRSEQGSLPDLQTVRPELPTDVGSIIRQATAKDPLRRFADALDMAAALREVKGVQASGKEGPQTIALSAPANPYKGLRAFQESDALDFFGRDTLVQTLLDRLDHEENRLLAVVGPSGSGKSSVVRAGLVPALRLGALKGSDHWFVARLTPGSDPIEALEAALLRIAINPPDSLRRQLLEDERGLLRAIKRSLPDDQSHLLLIIDQFEELFTLVEDEEAIGRFLSSLATAVDDQAKRLCVIVVLRADFYDRPLLYPTFGALLRDHMVTVLPLTAEELEQAIVRPAQRVGVAFESGLVATIIDDLSREPGALPLLQYALTELFAESDGDTLTQEAYRAIGGVTGALARRAEALFLAQDGDGRDSVRQLFLRLVAVDEEQERSAIPDTRRRVARSELLDLAGGEARITAIVDDFAAHRLLTLDHDPATRRPTVEVAHEALLREWSRLRSWLQESRDDLYQHRRLQALTGEWLAADHDPGLLLRQTRLERFSAWSAQTNLALTAEEHHFLADSVAARDRRRSKEQERRERELDTAQKLAETERRRAEEQFSTARRLRHYTTFLALALLLVAILAVLALFSGRQASQNAQQAQANEQSAATQEAIALISAAGAATAESRAVQQSELAQEQAHLATSRQLAGAAQLNLDTDPELALLLALEALQESHTGEAVDALHQAVYHARLDRAYYGFGNWAYWLQISPDGSRLAASGISGSKIWDMNSGEQLADLAGYDIVFQGDGDQWRTSERTPDNQGLSISRWEASAAEPLESRPVQNFEAGEGRWIYFFNDDYTRLVVVFEDGHAELWDAGNGEELLNWQAHEEPIFNVAFNPETDIVATIAGDVRLWDTKNGEHLLTLPASSSDGANRAGVAFSPDGQWLAANSADSPGDITVWDLPASISAAEGHPLTTLLGHTNLINSFAVSADGLWLATGSQDGTARLWSMSEGGGRLAQTFPGHHGGVISLAFAEDGRRLFTGDQEGIIRSWDISSEGEGERFVLQYPPAIFSLAGDPTSDQFAASGLDGMVRIGSSLDGATLRAFPAHDGFAYQVAFTPDGRRLATSGSDNRVSVWDSTDGALLFSVGGHDEGVSAGIWPNLQAIAFSPDGTILATGGSDGRIKLWDANDGSELAWGQAISYPQSGATAPILALRFSPDGKYLLGAGDSPLIEVYDLESEEHLLTIPSGFRGSGISFDREGAQLAAGNWDGELRVYDFMGSLDQGQAVERWATVAHDNFVTGTAFSDDGLLLASSSLDGSVRVWDPSTGQNLFSLPGSGAAINDLAFTSDGEQLLAAGLDGAVRSYVIDTDDLIDLAHSRLTRWWQPQECRRFLRDSCPPAPDAENRSFRQAVATPQEIYGTWQAVGRSPLPIVSYGENGQLKAADSIAGIDTTRAALDYEFQEGDIFVSDERCGEAIGRYTLSLAYAPGQDAHLILTVQDDPCEPRREILGRDFRRIEQ